MSSAIHKEIQEASKPGLWSLGVKLSRGGAVAMESKSASEVVMRVKVASRPVAYSVVLYPIDLAWECNCDGPVDPCEHVCAAAISFDVQGEALKSVEQHWSHVVYRFEREPLGLSLRRTVEPVVAGVPQEISGPVSLASILQTPEGRERVQVESYDLACDRLLARPRRGALPPELLLPAMEALTPASRVLLDGAAVSISAQPLRPKVVVEDDGEDVRVSHVLEPHERLSKGIVRVGDVLMKLAASSEVNSSKTYPPSAFADLSSKVLVDLARRFPLEMRSKRLPPIDRDLKPRIQFELVQLEGGLNVLPTLVYGAPAHVRIDSGHMTHFKGSVPLRDEAAEQRLIFELKEKLDLVPGRRTTISSSDWGRWSDKFKRFGAQFTGGAANAFGDDVRLRPKLSLEPWQLEFEVEGGKGETVSGEAVMRAFNEGLSLVPLLSGGWAPLPMEWLNQHGARILELLESRGADGQVPRALAQQMVETAQALEMPAPMHLEALKPLFDGFTAVPQVPVPDDVTAELRPYQQAGFRWLHFLRDAQLGAVLADDMGLGKTLQAIAVLPRRSLVVCPTSVLPNWVSELKRFRPSYRVCAYHGPSRSLDDTADVTVTSYALLRLDQDELKKKEWAALVLDEAQAIKNPDSQVATAAFSIPAKFKVALSGTPIENRLEELWSVMHFANPGLLGGKRAFEERWARPVAEGQKGAADALRKRIKPFVLRRLKRDVAPELPPRTEAVLPVELDGRERDIYQSVYAATRTEVVSMLQKGGGVMAALEALLRLRQAACHAGLVPGQQAVSSSKMRALVDALETAAADGHKALVFSQWTSLLDLIEPELKAAQVAFERLDGSTADREGVTRRFQSDQGAPVMLISLKAGGTGLNLTAADHVFLMDPWWNPAAEAQAADRAHRIGQTRPVTVYRLVAQNTVEERILELQQKKRALFDAALGEAEAGAALTKDDLLQLLA